MMCAGPSVHSEMLPSVASSSHSWQRGQDAVDAVMEECISLDDAESGAAGIAVVTTTSGVEYHSINTAVQSKGGEPADWRKSSPRTPSREREAST